MWKVIISLDVQKFLKKQDPQIEMRIKEKLRKLNCENPFHFLEHFEGQEYYKYRMGEYRALLDIDFENNTLKIQIVDHRKKIYKR